MHSLIDTTHSVNVAIWLCVCARTIFLTNISIFIKQKIAECNHRKHQMNTVHRTNPIHSFIQSQTNTCRLRDIYGYYTETVNASVNINTTKGSLRMQKVYFWWMRISRKHSASKTEQSNTHTHTQNSIRHRLV